MIISGIESYKPLVSNNDYQKLEQKYLQEQESADAKGEEFSFDDFINDEASIIEEAVGGGKTEKASVYAQALSKGNQGTQITVNPYAYYGTNIDYSKIAQAYMDPPLTEEEIIEAAEKNFMRRLVEKTGNEEIIHLNDTTMRCTSGDRIYTATYNPNNGDLTNCVWVSVNEEDNELTFYGGNTIELENNLRKSKNYNKQSAVIVNDDGSVLVITVTKKGAGREWEDKGFYSYTETLYDTVGNVIETNTTKKYNEAIQLWNSHYSGGNPPFDWGSEKIKTTGPRK